MKDRLRKNPTNVSPWLVADAGFGMARAAEDTECSAPGEGTQPTAERLRKSFVGPIPDDYSAPRASSRSASARRVAILPITLQGPVDATWTLQTKQGHLLTPDNAIENRNGRQVLPLKAWRKLQKQRVGGAHSIKHETQGKCSAAYPMTVPTNAERCIRQYLRSSAEITDRKVGRRRLRLQAWPTLRLRDHRQGGLWFTNGARAE